MNDKELARQLYRDKNKKPTEQEKNEFIRLVKAGIIDPYEFYSPGRFIHNDYVKLMVQNNWCIDEIRQIENYNHICILINEGKSTEYYEEWKTHRNIEIRWTLAKNGYFPEDLMNDNDNDVKMRVLETYPEYMKYCLRDESLFDRIHDYLCFTDEPDIETLQAHFMVNRNKIKWSNRITRDSIFKAYKLKHEAMSHTPTAVETTMTQKQLYDIGSPLWARQEPIYRLHDFLYRIDNGEITIDEYLNEKDA